MIVAIVAAAALALQPSGLLRPCSRAPAACIRLSATESAADGIVTLAEVEAAAERMGCTLSVQATGPAYRIELLWEGGKAMPAPRVQTLGYNDEVRARTTRTHARTRAPVHVPMASR